MDILHSKIYGQEQPGIPLLVFHGLFGMLDNFGSFGKEMSQYFPVHLIDLRNHGKSFHSEEMSHDALARDISNYMEFHQLSTANLLGHSLGGKAVMQFAINFPLKVNKLIVVDISPKAYPPHHEVIMTALESVDFNAISTRQEAEAILQEHIPERGTVQFLAKSLHWTDDKKLAWRFNLQTLSEKYDEFITHAIKYGVFLGKTLFIAGAKSRYILPEDEFPISQQFPNSSIVQIANAGHWVQAENPKDFNQSVKDFILADVNI